MKSARRPSSHVSRPRSHRYPRLSAPGRSSLAVSPSILPAQKLSTARRPIRKKIRRSPPAPSPSTFATFPTPPRSRPQPAEVCVLPTRFRALHADLQPCVCVHYARSDEPPAQIARSTHASTCPPRASPRQPGLLHLQLLPASAPGALISLGRLSFTCAAIQRSWRRHLGSTLMFSLTTSIALYCDHYNLKTALRAPLFSSLSTRRRRPHTQPPRQQSSGD